MWKTVIVTAGLVLAAMPSWGQSRSEDDDYQRGSQSEWRRDSDRQGRGSSDEDSGGRPARFFLRSGDTQIEVTCDARESTRSCVESVTMLFERVRSQQPVATQGTIPPTAPAPGSTPPPR
jgi:hypothetical protein